jgi:hypothetical protein
MTAFLSCICNSWHIGLEIYGISLLNKRRYIRHSPPSKPPRKEKEIEKERLKERRDRNSYCICRG